MTWEEVCRAHEEGWSLLPVGPDKKPLIAWKLCQDTPASLDQIYKWASELNPAIWAGATGAVSGRNTLDFDAPDGPRTMKELHLQPHRATPNDGFHVDVEHPGWDVSTVSHKTKKALGKVYPGLDVRGTGGYINLIGSTTTGAYRWLSDDRRPLPLDQLPEDLRSELGLLHPPSVPTHLPAATSIGAVDLTSVNPDVEIEGDPLSAAIVLLCQALRRVQTEGRNDAGFWLCCQLRDERFTYADAADVAQRFAELVPATNTKGVVEPYEVEDALASLQQAWSRPRRSSWLQMGPPLVDVSDRQLRDLAADAVAAIIDDNDPPHLFIRGSAVNRILRDDTGRPRTDVLRVDEMRHELSLAATWIRPSPYGGPPNNVHPPASVARDLLVRQWEELPRLTALIEAPCLRPDGTLLTEPGWDKTTGLWLDPNSNLEVPPVPENPSKTEIAAALGLLRDELLGEFQFVDPASQANALALMLTTVLRPAIEGLIPLALIDAPVAGTGKTLLANLGSRIATGRPAGLTAAPSGDDEELRKRITALLIAGESLIVFDNVSATLRSPVLAQALTSESWADRVLGASRMVHLPQRAVWAATGNNVQVGGDLARRCYPIHLDPKMAQPWRRKFRRPDLDTWVINNRGSLLAAALTLGRAWFARDRPDGGAPQWGSYQRWADTLAGILTNAGVNGFLGNLQDLYESADVETAGWQRVLAHWHQLHGETPVRVGTLELALHQAQDLDPPPSITNAIGYAPDPGTRNTRLAQRIRAVEGRRFDDTGLRIERAGTHGHSKGVLWQVTRDYPTPNASTSE